MKMASVSNVLRTCGLIIYLLFYANASFDNTPEPWILSLKISNKICDESTCKYLLKVHGGEFLGHYSWRLTSAEGARGGNCDVIHSTYEIKEVETAQFFTDFEIILPKTEGKIYFCFLHNAVENSPFGGRWVHQGVQYYLDPRNDRISPENNDLSSTTTKIIGMEDLQKSTTQLGDLSHDIDVNYLPNAKPRLTRDEKNDIEILIDGEYVPLNALHVRTNEENVGKDFNALDEGTHFIERFKRELINEKTHENVPNYVKSAEKIDDELNTLNFNIANEKDQIKGDINNKAEEENKDVNIFNRPSQHSALLKNNIENPKVNTSKFDNTQITNNLKVTASGFDNNKNTLFPNEDVYQGQNSDSYSKLSTNIVEDVEKIRNTRQLRNIPEFSTVRADNIVINIEGIRIEDSGKEPNIIDESIPSVLADTNVVLRVFGEGLTSRTVIAFTHDNQLYGEPCKFLVKGEYMVKEGSLKHKTALFEFTAPTPLTESKLYICAKTLKPGNTNPSLDQEKFIHQGNDTFKMFATHNSLLPLWFSLSLILVCLMFSALFSGLNLGLMSLDRTELKIISNTGTEQERKYARAIIPVRDHGNYLLCSILLGNVAVNSTFTILLDELTSGLFAVIVSTLAIVLLGEITPQAICSRFGLMIGAKSIVVTKAVMALTAPMAFPVSKLLDYFLGEEIGSVYNRERLKELVKLTTDVNDLDRDEVNIISGALELRKKTVSDVMTKLEDVFMLPISSVLDFETMSEIVKSGYSRIPVFEGSRGNIVTVLFIKDLAFVDPDDNTPLRTLCHYYQNACNFVFEDVTLDVMFKQFKEGNKGHMAFVHRINNEGEGDPFYETIGLVTLEDVIEEMIQAEIVDETDVFMDNRTKRRRNRPPNKLQDFAAFAERHENQRIHISPQLTLATFQFLSTSVDAFRPDTVSETVLRRLLRQDVIHHIKMKGKAKKDPTTFVFQQGKPVDYFVLILEGRVEVTVGRENLVFEAGPFTYFGVQALTQNVGLAESPTPSAMGSLQNINMDAMLRHTFVPDYSVRAITELFYLTVKRSLYLAAKRATLMEKGALSKGATNEQFDTEVDKFQNLCNSSSANTPISMISKKLLGNSASNASASKDNDFLDSTSDVNKLLQSVDEDMSISGEHKTPSRQVSPHPLPVSASPHTRASFATDRNGDVYTAARPDEQEKLLK